jgi:hypothetical protein
MSRGGFSDVGLHTGALKKATCWPLVHSTLLELVKSQYLFDKFLIRFDLQQLKKQVNQMKMECPMQMDVDVACKIADELVLKSLALSKKCRFDLKEVAESCTNLMNELGAIVEDFRTQQAAESTIDFCSIFEKVKGYLSISSKIQTESRYQVMLRKITIHST